MATDVEVKKLILAIEGEEEAARLGTRIQGVEGHIEALRLKMSATPPGTPLFDQIDRAVKANVASLIDLRRELDRAEKKAAGGSLVGAARTATKARGAMFLGNTAQDVIQGGPASAVNNILGAMGDRKLMALGGEYASSFVAAAGGAATLSTAIAGIGVAAGAAFLLIDTGLKDAKLGWSDLGTVLENTAPIAAAGEAISGVGVILTDVGEATGVTVAFSTLYDVAGELIHGLANLALGWDDATAAARQHNDEVARGTRAAHDYADAVKSLKSVQSEQQQAASKTGKLVGQEIADLGGAGGVDAVAAAVAAKMTARGADDKVKVFTEGKDEKGHPVVKEEEVTRREAARRDVLTDIGRAQQGDTAALGRLRPLLKSAGYDTDALDSAAAGVDPKETRKAAEKAKAAGIKAGEDLVKKEAADAQKWEREQEQQFKRDVAAARRSRSFLAGGDLTPAQTEAKRQHDELEAGVAAARDTGSYAGKEDEDLTPAERVAKGRDEDDRRAEAKQQSQDDALARVRKAKEREERADVSDRLDNTNFDDQLQLNLLQRQMAGQSANGAGDEVKRNLARFFQDKYGLSEEEARDEAGDRVRDAQRSNRRDAGRDGQKAEITDAQNYSQRLLLSGLGGDAQERTARDTARMVELLEKISQNPQGRDRALALYSE